MYIIRPIEELNKLNQYSKTYTVTINNQDGTTILLDDVVSIAFSESVLSVAKIGMVSYYRIKHLKSWNVAADNDLKGELECYRFNDGVVTIEDENGH